MLFLCGIRFSFRVSVKVMVRLKVLLTRLTLIVLHVSVREWLASSHLLNKSNWAVLSIKLVLRVDILLPECGSGRKVST